ncbi:unnamed protein product [Parnassius apollo]|uniref:(apollo) hypothetical protein n=1 Tax=Parnassius apollo TaxID=110799 RepID=A0A8S3Y4G4_PARAO|nr:unnamed protein product [Parnassius apollo]
MLSDYQSDASSLEDDDESFDTDETVEYRTEDAFKLSQQVMLSDYLSDASSLEDDDESFHTSETIEYRTEDTSTILQRKRRMETDNSSKERKRVKFRAQSNSSKSTSDNERSDHNLDGVVRGSNNLVEECHVPSDSNLEEHEQEKETRKDKAVQKSNSLLRTTRHCSGASTGFEQNRPVGVMLIHDDYRSRIPRKILFTSLNAAIKHFKIN